MNLSGGQSNFPCDTFLLSFDMHINWMRRGEMEGQQRRGAYGKLPTFALASVKLFNVVDFPLEGLPTRAIRGSRGIFPNVSCSFFPFLQHVIMTSKFMSSSLHKILC